MSKFDKYGYTINEVEPCLLHLDLWSTNILTEGGRISGILDFDRGMFGDPELEFAVIDVYGYTTKEFFTGYGRPRPSGKDAEIRRKLYTVYELIKYTFIRWARGRSMSVARRHIYECQSIFKTL